VGTEEEEEEKKCGVQAKKNTPPKRTHVKGKEEKGREAHT
jgi:hypothetical protein